MNALALRVLETPEFVVLSSQGLRSVDAAFRTHLDHCH